MAQDALHPGAFLQSQRLAGAAGHPFAAAENPLHYQQLHTSVTGPLTTRSRAASTSSSILSSSSASTSFSHSSDYASPLPPFDGGSLPRLLAGDGAGFAVQLPSGEQFVVPWGELVGLLVDPRTTSMLPETHLVKKLAEVLTTMQEPMIAPQSIPYIKTPSLDGVMTNLHSLSVRLPHPPHSRIPRRASPPHQSLPPPPFPSSIPSFAYSPSPVLSTASFATYPPPSTRRDPPLRSSSYITPLQQAFLPSTPHSSTPTPFAMQSSQQRDIERERAHRDRESQREQSRPYPRPSSQHSTYSSPSEFIHSRPPSQYASHSNSSSEYHDLPEPRVLRPVNSTAEHYLWNAALGLLYCLGADFESRASLDGQTVISFPPGSYHKVVKEDLEILPSDGKAINEWLRGQECVGTCRFRNRARGYQSSLSFVPGGRPGGSPDWSDSASVSDGASTYERAVGLLGDGGELHFGDSPATIPEQLQTEFMQQDESSELALHALISSTSTEWDPWLAEYGLEAPTGNRASALPDEPTQHSGSFLSMEEE